MKKYNICLIIAATLCLIGALGVQALKASSESKKESVQTGPISQQESSPGTEKVSGLVVFDSSQVIPKGPQWLGAPIMPDGTTLKQESGRLSTDYNLPYTQVLTWYQEALKRYPHARYRDWKEEMYIEDQGGSKWHAIIISKTGGPKTTVTIVKDNWTWIIATLFVRFTGVFVVLLVLWIGLNISGAVMQRFFKEEEKSPGIKKK
jgi:hypothetical protein